LRRRKEGRREQTWDSHICSKRGRLPLLISGGQHDGAPLSAGVWLVPQRVLCVVLLVLVLVLLLLLAGFLTCARLARGRQRQTEALLSRA
jgi:hypothetical protein